MSMSHRALNGKQFLHGTSMANVDAILEHGVKTSEMGGMGPGFYVTDNPTVAEGFASNRDRRLVRQGERLPDIPGRAVLRGSVDVQNPKVYKDYTEAYTHASSLGFAGLAPLAKHLRAQGHDALHIAGAETVLFNKDSFRPTDVLDYDHDKENWVSLT